MNRFMLVSFAICSILWLARPPEYRAEEKPPIKTALGFNHDIRPILSNHCLKCHGPDLKKGGLDLQNREAAFKKLKSGAFAIVPGKSAESRLIVRVCSEDEAELMPPKGKGARLKPEQVAKLRAWIDQGAAWEEHWAYVKPVRPTLPSLKNQAWARNGIDAFILARLEQEGLAPAPEADKTTLIRRASLALIGLPPTIQEVDNFLADASPDAYEKVVDRLLASPHYGERQALPWLDQARYADTNGYEKDDRRTIWPYRDWVIDALNRDLPFDQFTIEQIAGDLLPAATMQQKVATGFHRNTMVNTEGGTDDEEFRVAAIVDRVNTTMGVWMGTTMACAQCHNHKFDPFTQKEYYQLFSFFNHSQDQGRSNEPQMRMPTLEETKRTLQLTFDIAEMQKVIDTPTPELAAAQTKWEKSLEGQKAIWVPLEVISLASKNGATLAKQKDGSLLVTGTHPDTDTYTLVLQTNLIGISAFRMEALPDASLPAKGPGRAANGNFVLNELKVSAASKSSPTPTQAAPLQNAAADHAQPDFAVAGAIDGNATTGWAIAPQFGHAHVAVFETKQDVGLQDGTILTITIEQNHGSKHTLGKFRLTATTAPRPVKPSQLPAPVLEILAAPIEKRSPAQNNDLAKYYRSITPGLAAQREKLIKAKAELAGIQPVTTLVMAETTPRATHVMIRGNHKDLGEPVAPGVPVKLHPLPQEQPRNRLTLARWLVSPDNPLVGRVTMNRLWAQHFGRGLVETSEEFGAQGEPPTHPELLDWLAVEFVEQRWSMKAMHRRIVTSATYRQSSRVTQAMVERDSFNRLYARGPRFRIDAELVRDNALAISGLLHRKIGGPSVFPFQPEGVWANPYSGDRWVTSVQGNQYRRGLYTFWRRTAPYASFMAFDAPSREIVCERRSRTNTPLQALATLNDKVFVEASGGLARRIMSEVKGSSKQRAIHGFRLCVSRVPTAAELDLILKLYEDCLAKYAKDPAAARQLASSGLPDLGKEFDPAELAAWTVVANVLLNLDETFTKS